VSPTPNTSISAGNIGRMYDGSFDPDALKNTNTNAAQTSAKRRHANPLPARGASRHARRDAVLAGDAVKRFALADRIQFFRHRPGSGSSTAGTGRLDARRGCFRDRRRVMSGAAAQAKRQQ